MTDGQPTRFAELLRQHRSRARLSQEELAERAGLSVRAISNLERGVNRTPRYATVRMLAAALELADLDQASFEAAASGDTISTGAVPTVSQSLPRQLTSFIGRERELERIRRELRRPEVRLLTLRGTGGSGKTRIAVRLAEELMADFADGVVFVGLASVTQPDLVIPTIGQALGISETADRSLAETLEHYLAGKDLLLVLDNFEHLLPAGSLVTRLLEACPRVKALVTSRVALRVRGEHDFQIPPLALPDSGWPEAAGIEQYEAVQLFVARAQAVKQDFTITRDNAPAVIEICRRLDGIPLAIELAAARCRLLTPQALLDRLDNRLTLLTSGPRDAPARQRTLRATLDWSHRLLDEPVQRLLRRLSIYPAGCTLETAEVVCDIGDVPDVLEGIAALVDSSLLRQEESPEGQVRFEMLEIIREYALARLAESGEEQAARQRQATHYLRLAELASSEFYGPRQLTWVQWLETEHNNLRAAIDWGFSPAGDVQAGLRLAAALWPFWDLRGYLTEGRRRLSRALEVAESSGVTAGASGSWAEALRGAGVLSQRQGDYTVAHDFLTRSRACFREAGDTRGLALALNSLGRIAQDRGDYDAARTLYEECLALYQEMADRHGISDALLSLGVVAYCLADYDRARVFLIDSLAIKRASSDTRGIATILQRLSYVMRHQGNLTEARAVAEESLALHRELGDRWGVAYSLNTLGNIARDQEDYAGAIPLLQECLELQRELGDRQGAAYSLHQLGIAAREQGELTSARRLAEMGLTMFRQLDHRRGVAYALTSLGAVARQQGEGAEAREYLEESLKLQSELGDRRGIANAAEELAALAMTQDEPDRAAVLLAAVAAIREALGGVPPAIDHPHSSRVTVARARLGHDRFAALWAVGRAMTLDAMIACALDRPDAS